MANTYTLIEAKTLGSAVSSVTFSSIPSTYTDLNLLCSIRTSRGGIAENMLFTFNSSTSSFSSKILVGQGGGGIDNAAIARFAGVADGDTATSNTFASFSIYIPNYASSNYKSYSADTVMENNSSDAYAVLTAGLWSDTSAISGITLTPAIGSNLMINSTFYLYGISNS